MFNFGLKSDLRQTAHHPRNMDIECETTEIKIDAIYAKITVLYMLFSVLNVKDSRSHWLLLTTQCKTLSKNANTNNTIAGMYSSVRLIRCVCLDPYVRMTSDADSESVVSCSLQRIPITGSVLAITRSVSVITRSVLVITGSVLVISRSVLVITGSVLVITRSVLVITGSVLVISKSVLVIMGSVLVMTGSVLVITGSVLVITRSVLVITRSVLVIMGSVLVIRGSVLVIARPVLVITRSVLVTRTLC